MLIKKIVLAFFTPLLLSTGQCSHSAFRYNHANESLVGWSKYVKTFFTNMILENEKHLLDSLHQNNTNSSNTCLQAFLNLNRRHLTSVIDSMFKPVAGILEGNVAWLGNYRECMKQDGLHFCMVAGVLIDGKLPVTIGLCVPEVCSIKDVLLLLTTLSNLTKIGKVAPIKVLDTGQKNQLCYNKDIVRYSNGAIIMLAITALIVFICFLGTITEFINSRYNKKYKLISNDEADQRLAEKEKHSIRQYSPNGRNDVDISMHKVSLERNESSLLNFLLCFSVLKNTRAILDTSVPKGSITSLNGMRTLSITWVILGHCLAFSFTYIDDPYIVFSWLTKFSMQGIINAGVAVDTFFFLSGLLVAYLSMKRFDAKGKLPLLRYYVHRYFRLTPSYAYLLFFYAYLFPLMGQGPYQLVFGPGNQQSEYCISNWWSNLLYINNLYPESSQMCFVWSWYLSNDMQFYIISPIILYLMYRFHWIGLISVNGFLLVGCFLCNALLIYFYDLVPISNFKNLLTDTKMMKRLNDYQVYVYIRPYTRISPYIVGIILGYILHKKYKIHSKYSKIFYSLGWSCGIATGLAIVYGPYSNGSKPWGMAEFVIYGTFFRFAWAVAIGWVLYACHHGNGGIVNSVLSWKVLIPLSRLTYGVYLVHPMVIWYYYYMANVPTDFTIAFYVYNFISCTGISFMLAFIVAVFIEYPVFNLEKLITK